MAEPTALGARIFDPFMFVVVLWLMIVKCRGFVGRHDDQCMTKITPIFVVANEGTYFAVT